MAAPTFVGANTVAAVAGQVIFITQPSGTTTGDVLYAFFSQLEIGEDSIPEHDPDWQISNGQLIHDNANTTRLIVMRRVIESGDPSNWALSWGDVMDLQIAGAISVRGADTINPEAAVGTPSTGDDDSPDPPASGTVSSGDYLAIAFFGIQGKRAPSTPPTNYTERIDHESTGGGGPNSHVAMGVATRELTGITSENPGVFTADAGDTWAAGTILVAEGGQDQTVVVNEVAETEAAVAVAVGDSPVSIGVTAAAEIEAAVAVAVIQPAAQSIGVTAAAEVEAAVAIDAVEAAAGATNLVVGVF